METAHEELALMDQGSGLESDRHHGGPSAGLLAEIDEASERLDTADPAEIISWAVEKFPGQVAVAAAGVFVFST